MLYLWSNNLTSQSLMAPQSSCDDQNVDDGQDFQKLPFAVGLLINIAL